MQSHRAFQKIKDNNIWHLRQNQYSARVISLATLKQVDNLLLLILLCLFYQVSGSVVIKSAGLHSSLIISRTYFEC